LTYRLQTPGRRHIILGSNLLPGFDAPLANDAILYNLEQIQDGSSWLQPAFLELLSRYAVWDYSQQNIDRLAEKGIAKVVHLPIGYAPPLQRIETRKDEDIDVLFVGSINDRRQKILGALEKKGLRVHRAVGVYGAARDALVARAKVVLNLHYYEAKVFEVVRVSYLLANRRFVISEEGAPSEDEASLRQGLVFAPYEKLVETCCDWLAKPERRAEVASRGQSLFQARDVASYLKVALDRAA
jgi:hypothetical protein